MAIFVVSTQASSVYLLGEVEIASCRLAIVQNVQTDAWEPGLYKMKFLMANLLNNVMVNQRQDLSVNHNDSVSGTCDVEKGVLTPKLIVVDSSVEGRFLDLATLANDRAHIHHQGILVKVATATPTTL